jgi:hypothetical protein
VTEASTSLVRTDLSGIDEHITAMVEADSGSAAIAVLASSNRCHLGGIRLTCDLHGGRDMTFAQLLKHTGLSHHEPRDIHVADPDPIEIRKMGGDL